MSPDGVRIALVGGSGRVGGALVEALGERHAVHVVERSELDPDKARELRDRLADSDVVVNAAGVAHLDREPTPADIARLVAANVLLPLELAERCVETGTPFVHISSSKAASRDRTAYAWSKRAGDDVLTATLDERFRAQGIPLVVVRPPAMLFPPFDAGKLRWFRNLDRLPAGLTPPLRLPIVTSDRFVARIEELVRDAAAARLTAGVSYVEFARSESGTLADVHAAVHRARREDRPE